MVVVGSTYINLINKTSCQQIMQIKRNQLRELQYLQEDIAEYFTDENMVSGETYWTCIESIAIAKLAELRGDIIYTEE